MRFINRFFSKKKGRLAYKSLSMGLIRHYSLIIPSKDLQLWLKQGWVEAPGFYDFHYAPRVGETVIIKRPKTLSETGYSSIVGKIITDFWDSCGSYGMGGPGFFGLVLKDKIATETKQFDENVLVFAAWGAKQYTLIDRRVVGCHPGYYDDFHPWFSFWSDEDIPNWDDLTPVLVGSRIGGVELSDDHCTIEIKKDDARHVIEFLKNDPALPPMGNGEARKDAFSSGVIGNYLVFQHEQGVLFL